MNLLGGLESLFFCPGLTDDLILFDEEKEEGKYIYYCYTCQTPKYLHSYCH